MDTILYYKTDIKKDAYVVANEYNINDRIKYAEKNEHFVEWNEESEFSIKLLIDANRKMRNYENY